MPANTNYFEIPQFFSIVDDNIDEDEQSFAVVAEMFLMESVVSRLQKGIQNALEDEEQQKLGSLTTIVNSFMFSLTF